MKKLKKRLESVKVSAFKSIAYTVLCASNVTDTVKFFWVATANTFNRCPVCGKRKSKAEVKDINGIVVSCLVYCGNCEQASLDTFKQMNTNWTGQETPQA